MESFQRGTAFAPTVSRTTVKNANESVLTLTSLLYRHRDGAAGVPLSVGSGVRHPLKAVVVVKAAAVEGRILKFRISEFIFLRDPRDILCLFNKRMQLQINIQLIKPRLSLESALDITPVSYFHSIFIPSLNPFA